MKRPFLFFVLGIAVVLCIAAGWTRIFHGRMDSDFNANQFSLTNVNQISDTNGNPMTSKFIGRTNGSGLSNSFSFPTSFSPIVLAGGRYSGIRLSNAIVSSRATNFILPAAQFDGGSNAIYFPVGFNLSGQGPENTTVQIYNTSPDFTTNGGSLWLSDNCSVQNLFLNQTNWEAWPITSIGAQRKNQTSPIPNTMLTSTNVVIRNVTVHGAKTAAIVINCTNTWNWKIIHCELSANINEALSLGLASTSGDGPNPDYVMNTNDVTEISDTSLSVTNRLAEEERALYINQSGALIKAQLNNITLMGAASDYAVRVVGTNNTLFLSILGAQFHPNSSNYLSLYITGISNTIYCGRGIQSWQDAGSGNQVIFTDNGTAPIITVNNSFTPFVASNDPYASGTAWSVIVTNGSASTSTVMWTNTYAQPFPQGHYPHILGPTLSGGPAIVPTSRPYISLVTESNCLVSIGPGPYPSRQTNKWTFLLFP